MLQALQRGWQAMVVSLLSNFAGFLIFAYLFYYTNKHDVIRLMYLYSCTTAFGAVVGICLLIYPMLKLYKKSKIQREKMQDENNEMNNNNEVHLQEIRNMNETKKLSLKEIRKSSSKFESNYVDLDSNLASAINISHADYETKDNDNSNENETKNIPEL